MQELDKLNPRHGTATDSMALFLAINTSNVTLLPTGVIALRAAAGSVDPAGILPTTLFATVCSTIAAIFAAKAFSRLPMFKRTRPLEIEKEKEEDGTGSDGDTPSEETPTGYPVWVSGIGVCALIALIPLTIFFGRSISPWIIPGLMLGFLAFGVCPAGAYLRGLCGRGQGRLPGGYQDYPLLSGNPCGSGDVSCQRCHGGDGQYDWGSYISTGYACRSSPYGTFEAPCPDPGHYGIMASIIKRARHRPGQLYRLSRVQRCRDLQKPPFMC